MPSSAFENLLALLDALRDATLSADANIDPKAVATDIAVVVNNDLHPDERDLAHSVLFDPERGLLRFLQKTRGQKIFDPAKILLLEFTAETLAKPWSLSAYLADIKSGCLAVLVSPQESTKVKQAAFGPLLAILTSKHLSIDGADFDVAGLYERLWREYVTLNKKLSASVRAGLFQVLACIVKQHSQRLDQRNVLAFYRSLVQTTERQLFDVHTIPEMPLVVGSLRALDSILHIRPVPDPNYVDVVYRVVRHVVAPIDDLNRYDIPKAGLEILVNHGDLFAERLFSDYPSIYANLKHLSIHKNRDVSRLAFRALDKFIEQIATVLSIRSASKDPTAEECFWFFITEFTGVLRRDQVDSDSVKQISLAIRGFGIFAGPSRNFLTEEDWHEIPDLLMRKSSLLFCEANTSLNDTLFHLSSLVQAFASIAKHSDSISEELSFKLDGISNLLFLHFPKLSNALKFENMKSFIELTRVLCTKHARVKSFWSTACYKALVYTSTDVMVEEPAGIEQGTDGPVHAYQEYMYFWKCLFNPAFHSTVPDEESDAFLDQIYDEIMWTILRLLRGLNLEAFERIPDDETGTPISMRVKDLPGLTGSSSDLTHLQPSRPKDFSIFVNLVEFARLFIADVATERFHRWVDVFGEQLMALSVQHPLVSGFYKLLASCLRHIKQMGPLQPQHASTDGHRAHFSRYLSEVPHRCLQYKDDLLVSCLELLLYAPWGLVDAKSLCQPLRVALKLGLTYSSMALAAIECLEMWSAKLEPENREHCFRLVLPGLLDYLRLDAGESLVDLSQSNDSGPKNAAEIDLLMPGSRKAGGTTASSGKLAKGTISTHSQALRRRILTLLGSLGEHSVLALSESVDPESLNPWDSESRIRLRFPFEDVNVDVHLDDLLPRIAELAEKSPDRKTKVAACELLHVIVIWMVGKTATAPHDNGTEPSKSPFYQIQVKIFPILLRLATDIDHLVRSMFHALVHQLIHWLARGQMRENTEAMAMLQTCLDATLSDDGALRDMGADCTLEFFECSLKTSGNKVDRNTDSGVQSLFTRLYEYCKHSNVNKRRGASLIFNRIYRAFRASNSLVEQFTFELLYHYLCNLRLSAAETESIGTWEQAGMAIDHLKKILIKKHAVFMVRSKVRRPFPGLESDDLPSLINWLFRETRHTESVYAQRCLELVLDLVPVFSDARRWFAGLVKKHPRLLVDIYEKSLAVPPARLPWCSIASEHQNGYLIAALNAYTSLIKTGMLAPQNLIGQGYRELVAASQDFMLRFQTADFAPGEALSSVSRNRARVLKTETAARIIALSAAILERLDDDHDHSELALLLFGDSFLYMLARLVFEWTGDLLFADAEGKQSFEATLASLLRAMLVRAPVKQKALFVDHVTAIGRIPKLVSEADATLESESSELHTTLQSVQGWKTLWCCGWQNEIMEKHKISSQALFDNIWSIVNKRTHQSLSISQRQLLEELVDWMTKSLDARTVLFENVLEPSQDKRDLCQQFPRQIHMAMATHFDEFVLASRRSSAVDRVLAILQDLGTYLINHCTHMESEIADWFAEVSQRKDYLDSIADKVASFRPDLVHTLVYTWKRFLFLSHKQAHRIDVEAVHSVLFAGIAVGLQSSVPLSIKVEAFEALPSFLRPSPNQSAYLSTIEKLLHQTVMSQLPVNASELAEGSAGREEYDNAALNLLSVFESSGALCVFNPLSFHICRQTQYHLADSVKQAVSKAAHLVPCMQFADMCFSYCFDGDIPSANRRTMVTLILVPFLTAIKSEDLSQVFQKYIRVISRSFNKSLPSRLTDIKPYLIEKSSAFDLMTISFCDLFPPEVFQESLHGLFVEFQQCAYNALAASTIKTQKKKSYYELFLFTDDHAKGEFVWKNIVDTKTAIKDIAYLSSQFLMDSSLAMSFGMFIDPNVPDVGDDIAPALHNDPTAALARTQAPIELSAATTPSNVHARISDSSIIEMDDLNKHPCMPTMMAVLQKLHEEITPPPPPSTERTLNAPLPKWMQKLLEKIQPGNWWGPLVQVILSSKEYGEGITYFVQDLLIQLITWIDDNGLTPEDNAPNRKLVSLLLAHLTAQAAHKSKHVINGNLKLMRPFVEKWGSLLTAPSAEMRQLITSDQNSSAMCGLYILSMLLSNRREAACSREETTLLLRAITSHFTARSQELLLVASHVAGQFLGFYKQHDPTLFEESRKWICKQIDETGTSETDRWVSIIASIAKNSPEIVGHYYRELLFNLPKLQGRAKAHCLEALGAAAADIPLLFQELQGKNLLALMTYRDDECQKLTLMILWKLASNLADDDILFFLEPALQLFQRHPNEPTRHAFYYLVVDLHRAFSSDGPHGPRHSQSGKGGQIYELLKKAMLQGLGDDDESVRTGLIEYIHRDLMGSSTVFKHLETLFSSLYFTEAEDSYLHYAAYLLLEKTKASPQITEVLFPDGFPSATFRELALDTSWTNSATMRPLFTTPRTQISTQHVVGGSSMDRTDTQPTLGFSLTADAAELRTHLVTPPIIDDKTQWAIQSPSRLGELRKRNYVHDEQQTVTYFSKQAERLRKSRWRAKAYQRDRILKSVALARKYRIGDLPDIQITFLDIIRPLQNLVQRDAEISQMLFANLVTALTKLCPPEERLEEELGAHLNRMIRSSTLFSHSENQISNVAAAPAPKRQKRHADAPRPFSQWKQVARLFRNLGSVEIYQGIHEEYLCSHPAIKAAISAETLGDFTHALRLYQEITDQLGSEDSSKLPEDEYSYMASCDILSQGQVECMAKLGSWDHLAATVERDLREYCGSFNTHVLWDDPIREPYLRLFIRTFIRLKTGYRSSSLDTGQNADVEMFVEWSNDHPNPLVGFLEREIADPANQLYLEKFFSTELAVNALNSNNPAAARYFVASAYDQWLKDFSHIGGHAQTIKRQLMNRLQVIEEIQEGLDLVLNIPQAQPIEALENLLLQWQNRYPSRITAPLDTWDDLATYRQHIMQWMTTSVKGQIADPQQLDDILRKHERQFAFEMITVAARRKNFSLAMSWLEHIHSGQAAAIDIFDEDYYYQLFNTTLLEIEARPAGQDMQQTATNLLLNFLFYQEHIERLDGPSKRRFQLLEGRFFSSLSSAMTTDAASAVDAKALKRKIVRRHFGTLASVDDLTPLAVQRAFDLLSAAGNATDNAARVEQKMHLASHCDAVLRFHELQANSDDQEMETTVIEQHKCVLAASILDSMALGSEEAISQFPRLLEFLGSAMFQADFKKRITIVPSWMFLRWLPNLTAIFDKPAGHTITPILMEVAKEYPEALRYPLNISSDQYAFDESTKLGRVQKAAHARLKEMIRSELADQLLRELKRLQEPIHVLKEWMERTELFARDNTEKITRLCGKDGSKIAEMTADDFKKNVVRFKGFEQRDLQGKSGSGVLKNYSRWLEEFHSNNYDETVEIPGQYHGRQRPNPSEHVTITSFSSKLLLLASIRKPKRLIINGSDEKEYPWLVKAGEDLRLDQRIQQIFGIMNGILRKNQYCLSQNMSIHTYKVVPMNTGLGIIEWVNNTKPLRQCMADIPGFNDELKRAKDIFFDSLKKMGGSYEIAAYTTAYRRVKADGYTRNMQQLWGCFSKPYLKESLLLLCKSPEAFFALRSRFSQTLAAFNICSYLLGIGDRHLENFLISQKSGEVIGIDFGLAFGSGAENLPIPEIVPFRVTKQMERMMEPLGVNVLLKIPMVHAMTAVQDEKRALVTALDIFAKEPIVEWRKYAKAQIEKQKRRGKYSSAEPDLSSEDSIAAVPAWYPKQKIQTAIRKLNRDPPLDILLEELARGHQEKDWFKALCQGLLETQEQPASSRPEAPTVEAQVSKLLSMATDPNILGRAYFGWTSFL
ncbi:uncharacterized protein BJ171DRAFT_576762 [Polychytrium aggregatum]|uniref:uncharacterized protein n=1 Tax=Polychytrium aggregatum TaxID=110093 RepID=UPI0022FDF9EC|nr:uncharacterized protein BJ171DRAFT_576762 [Polychytrium aggregatum]KAI9209180.1 hypothetical protein BJ171DRAFT_576762 [Polychytrium aggregatum]